MASEKVFLCPFGRVLATEGRVRSGNGTSYFCQNLWTSSCLWNLLKIKSHLADEYSTERLWQWQRVSVSATQRGLQASVVQWRLPNRGVRVEHFSYPTSTRTRWCLPVPVRDPCRKLLSDPTRPAGMPVPVA